LPLGTVRGREEADAFTIKHQAHKNIMKILHTITCTQFQPAYNAYEEFQRSLFRTRRLTEAGIQRMFKNGCEEYEANPEVNVVRVETAIYRSR
jgi:hypothetical protein